ncbi:hypothetical protein PVL29_011961 [Vitis rotundifolia]|uniref:Enoyl reductase (ER) domain-containing protein n=1 Tax=Vitis rotundifolia TaxID=103349 RepID=A0AA38ZQD1_VITRO|nr:hypothetical protein PVL29_011961 [Vitis rotundifolia]
MKAVVIATSGDPQVLQVQEVENPEIGDDEVLIRVDAAANNRADTLQRKGLHPPSKAVVPTPVSNVLESSKLLERLSFDRRLVCALLSGGGYAEKVVVLVGQDATGIPEVACIVWSTVLRMSRLSAGETFLVRGGSIGIATFSIQIGKYQGARVFVTSVDVCINYKTEDFAFIIGFQGGTVAEVNLSSLIARHLTVQECLASNHRRTNFQLMEAAEAHQLMESSKHVWKIQLIPLCYGYE